MPVFIQNSNGSEHDKAILAEFEEPAWAYPVVRFVNAKREDLIPRLPDVWQEHDMEAVIATHIEKALSAHGTKVPSPAALVIRKLRKGEDASAAELQEVGALFGGS